MPFDFEKTSEKNNQYEEIFQVTLKSICKERGQQPIEVRDIKGGQTDTLKRVIDFKEERLFIKIGEKVDLENKVYQSKYFENNPLFLKRFEKFSTGNILVLPYFDGLNLETQLIEEYSHLNQEKISLLNDLLHKTYNSFWSQNISKSTIDLVKMNHFINKRVELLYSEVGTINLEDEDIEMKRIFSTPIFYQKNKTEISLPSVEHMIVKVFSAFSSLKNCLSSCISGDFQPSNIIISGNSFKIVDLSNGSDNGDMALDIGKFFNFINRFHFVAKIRSAERGKSEIGNILTDKGLIIKSQNYPDILQLKLVENFEENFSEFIVSKTDNYSFPDRLKLYKFIVNLITLRRHLILGVPLDDLLSILVDSYYELETKVFNI